MAAFVVISTDNRLSGLVDGIEKCLPLNPDVGTHISTGKIEKEGDEYFYKYQINNEGNGGNGTEDLSNLVLNQLATFRLAYGVSGTLNVFMLENPRTEEELQLLETWLKNGFERLFSTNGAMAVQNIHIYRVLLTYDVEKPDDVASQLPPDILKSYLERRDKYAFNDSSSILCISNRDKDEAAISFGRKEHDIKLPRLLADFMMLLSSANNSYGVFNAINSSERCFSLGYAESMYYFPDVREYYQHADKRSLYERILKDQDEAAQLDDDEEAMNIESHPLGLNKRRGWLTGKYSDVPFDHDIKSHRGSADFIIDDCWLMLKTLYCRKREEEIERKKREVDSKIDKLNAEYNSMSQEVWESSEEFKARKKEKFEENKSKVRGLRDELNRFIASFPEFISRGKIFNYSNGFNNIKAREDYLKKAEEQYDKLVEYAKGNDFFDYVEEFDESRSNQQAVIPNSLQDNPGCWFKFWGRKPQEAPVFTPPPAPAPMLDNVKEIRKQLKLKKTFEDFLSKRDEIEQEMKVEEGWCNKFKLTDHSHHYYHLINLPKLKDYQKEEFDERFKEILKQWNADEDNRNLTQLKELLHKNTETYTEKLKYIDWNEPFPFVSDTSGTILAEVCSKLYEKSSPFVHYEKVTATAQNPITYALYSDIPDIEKRFNAFKDNVTNSTTIIPYHSTHISSKLCFFQFLPLDKEALDKLCETKEDSPAAHDKEGIDD